MSNDEPTISLKRPLYESSTQFRNWRFSPEHLFSLRTSLNAAAVDVIRNTLESEKPGSSEMVSFLSADDELLLVKLYITKITQLCGHFRFPEEVEATAITYLKRFYLKNTVMDWHPKNNIPDSPQDTKSLYESALTHIRASRLTDAELIYTPSQIALTAFSLAAPELASQWLRSKVPADPLALTTTTLPVLVDALASLIMTTGQPPDIEAVREVDRRLKLCKNPEKIVGSHAYLAKKAEEEKKAEEKRCKKASETVKDIQDPFHSTAKDSRGLVDYDDDDD
ncbi:hypothetical protein H0H87_011053 [Tephrocybe sp. NHM501043]|nr:hypothetical protein H0H87_011053 [Tephrocybe sp. NHM501043]